MLFWSLVFWKTKAHNSFKLSLQSDTSLYIVYLKAYANHLPEVQVMATISLQCNGLSQIHSSVYLRLKIVWQVEHTYMGEVLTQVWLKFVKKWVIWQTSECTKREKLPGFTQAPISSQNCAMKMKQTRKKRCMRKNVIDRRKLFIRRIRRTGENDLNKLLVNNSWHNEGTICLVNRWIGAKGMVFRAWTHKWAP